MFSFPFSRISLTQTPILTPPQTWLPLFSLQIKFSVPHCLWGGEVQEGEVTCHNCIFCSSSFYCFSHCSLHVCSREGPTGQSFFGSTAALAWVPHSCSPLGVFLPQHGSAMAAVPPAQSLFPVTFPGLCVLPLVAGTGTLKPLLNLPEVFGGDGLFMQVSEMPGTISGHLCNPLLPNPCY